MEQNKTFCKLGKQDIQYDIHRDAFGHRTASREQSNAPRVALRRWVGTRRQGE